MGDLPSRYQPLVDFLVACEDAEVELTFAEIEALIGRRLSVTLPGKEGRTATGDNIALRLSTRVATELRGEVDYLRERLREAERERGELRRMLNLEQQTVARLLPASVGPLGALEASPAVQAAGTT